MFIISTEQGIKNTIRIVMQDQEKWLMVFQRKLKHEKHV